MTAPPLEGAHFRQGTAGLAGDEPDSGRDPRDPVAIAPLYGPASPPPPGSALPAGPPGSPAPSAGSARDRVEVEPLNLAQRPFVNTRPVVRAAAILYLLGLALLALNVALFNGYLSASRDTRTKLAAAQKDVEHERSGVAALEKRLGSLSLDQENRAVTFLNRKIEERTFSWSLLLDRLSDVLPDDVRLLRLSPASLVQKDAETAVRAGHEPKPQPIVISMTCEAKSDEALLLFVDNLFAHPAFAEPNLVSEAREDTGLLRFEVTVQYQPHLPPRAASTGAAGTTGASRLSSRHRAAAATAAAGDAANTPAARAVPGTLAASPDEGAPPPAAAARSALPAGASLVPMVPTAPTAAPSAPALAPQIPPPPSFRLPPIPRRRHVARPVPPDEGTGNGNDPGTGNDTGTGNQESPR